MSNVKLAIRVRPFTDKEIKAEKERTQVVSVLDENTITITNMKVSVSGAGDSRERVRRYHADFTFDSACSQSLPTYASQEKVFNTMGRQVVESISRGSPACVLAYGQSATGKTHTMMGTDTQPGLIPRICRALADEQPFEITVSFLEIYNERVHDLLVEAASLTCNSLPRRKGNARKDLRVREHPTKGPYVQNLRRVAVHDVDSLLSVVYEGARRRRTAATRRNSTSSRSHAVLELVTPRATLHLADLAGSEKASWEGCGGGRQKEGSNINKSLVALSNVISALVRGGRGRYVPYRDSALTWLLKDCFTGTAPTFIIATVSPSIACYGESASTLRWAERARQLPVPRVNQTSCVTSRAALQTHLNKLLAELARQYIRYIPETGKIIYDDGHWTLLKKSFPNIENTEAKIGNLLSVSYPKTDAPNAEPALSSVDSSSSKVITMDKNMDVSKEISKEVDKIFGPALERTSSGSDLKVIASEKNTRRQYKSQEVLPIDKIIMPGHSSRLSNVSQSLSEVYVDETQNTDDDKFVPVPIVYDNNQRADIVASVTDRLYTKLKNKEVPVTKAEPIVDKKVPQPLSELRICTNARQRLVELSQKALRNKRRIGIPAHTQTKKSVIRMKDQEIEVQNDLELYVLNKKRQFVLYRDVCTETMPITPRYKDIGVGPTNGSLHVCDKSIITESKKVPVRNFATMTDTVKTADHSTQTPVLPSARRKKHATIFTRLMRKIEKNRNKKEESPPPIININISHPYQDSESSDDSEDKCGRFKRNFHCGVHKSSLPPDLLTNHRSANKKDKKKKKRSSHNSFENDVDDTDESILFLDERRGRPVTQRFNDDFPDPEDNVLPRVIVSPSSTPDPTDIKNIILGRSEDSYPYNIVLSPLKSRDDTKRLIKFKEIDISPAECCNFKWDDNNDGQDSRSNWIRYNDSRESLYSDCSSLSKLEPEMLTRRKSRVAHQSINMTDSTRKSYLTVPKINDYELGTYNIAKAKVYKEFLGLDEHPEQGNTYHRCSSPKLDPESDENDFGEHITDSQDLFKQRRQFFENKFSRGYYPHRDAFSNIERKIIHSCNKLELSSNRYEDYLNDYNQNRQMNDRKQMLTRTPTEYLKHLVQLRRDVIQANSHRSESFV